MAAVNPVRGEVELRLGGQEFVLVCTMQGLARVSAATGCEMMVELYKRMIGVELNMVFAAFREFVVRGTGPGGEKLKDRAAGEAAIAAYMLSDQDAVQEAFADLLKPFTREPKAGEEPDPGNGNAAASQ